MDSYVYFVGLGLLSGMVFAEVVPGRWQCYLERYTLEIAAALVGVWLVSCAVAASWIGG